jgi:hypothetical protein
MDVFAERTAYSQAAEARLAEIRSILAGINATIRNGVAASRMPPTLDLGQLQRAVLANLDDAQRHLDRLRHSDDAGWESCKVDMESAWEDLSRSIRRLVSVIPD